MSESPKQDSMWAAQDRYDDLRFALAQYKATGNGVWLADAFVDCVEHGIAPPAELLRWVASGLNSWCEGDGKGDLARMLDLVPQRGARSFFSELGRNFDDLFLLYAMDALVHLGATREEAAAIVSDRRVPSSESGRALSAETLLRKYSSKRERRTRELLELALDTQEQRAHFLANFNTTYMPPSLVAMTRDR